MGELKKKMDMQEMMAKNAAMLYKNDFDDDDRSDKVMGGGLGNEL